MTRRLVALLVLAITAPPRVALAQSDSVVTKFMKQTGLRSHQGVWFKRVDVDPMNDSVRVNMYVTFATTADLTNFDWPKRTAGNLQMLPTTFGMLNCVHADVPLDDKKYSHVPPTFALMSTDSLGLPQSSGVWIRYRVDSRAPSEWEQWQGGTGPRFVVAVSGDSAAKAHMRDALLWGSTKVLVRVRVRDEERDFHFSLNGFGPALIDCLGAP